MEKVFVFIEILFKMLLFKGGVLIYAEHCIIIIYNINICNFKYNFIPSCLPTFLFIYWQRVPPQKKLHDTTGYIEVVYCSNCVCV